MTRRPRAGVLSRRLVCDLFKNGVVVCDRKEPEMDHDASAFDLHLGRKCYVMKGTTKLREEEAVASALIGHHSKGEIDLTTPHTLAPGETYLIELQESLDFSHSPELHGRSTGKSTIGRLDVLTHLIVNDESRYDYVREAYKGNMFVQVTPLTFPITVKEGSCLNQLRVFWGHPRLSEIGPGVRELEGQLLMRDKDSPATKAIRDGCLSLSLAPVTIHGQKVSAFMARKNKYPTSAALNPNAKKGTYPPTEYWDLIPQCEHIEARPNRLYIVRSLERLTLPSDVAVTCIAMTENLGDVRIHYAGFAHPWFGSMRGGDKAGTPLMFEVRCFTKQVLRQGEIFAELKFHRMSEAVPKPQPPKETTGDYQRQELQLSKIFQDWPKNPRRVSLRRNSERR